MQTHERRYSVRKSLLWFLVPVSVVLMAAAWMMHGLLLDRMATDFVEERLREEAGFLQRQVYRTGTGLESLDTGEYFEDVFHHAFAIRTASSTITSPSRWESVLTDLLSADREGLLQSEEAVDSGAAGVLAYRRIFQFEGEPVVVVVAEDLGILESRHQQLHRWTGIAAMLMIVAMALAIWVGITVAMRPVRQLRKAVLDLQSGRSTRIAVRTPEEFQPLVEQLNQLLDTMDRRLERSREALANLSHSIKTPVAAVRTILEDRQQPVDDAMRAEIVRRLSDIDQQLEAEMRRSQFSGPQAGQSAQPVRQARDLLWMFGRLYPDKRFELDTSLAQQQRWPVEQHDLDEVMGNLLDNAGKWAENAVELSLREDSDGYHLFVCDDGPGVDESMWESLGTRGMRLDEKKSGHGLGLSIVIDIVERYGGHFTWRNTRRGGLRAEVQLPRPS
ncbi:MAG: ATP-binding protein [Pseudohongiellaceae bacterium]